MLENYPGYIKSFVDRVSDVEFNMERSLSFYATIEPHDTDPPGLYNGGVRKPGGGSGIGGVTPRPSRLPGLSEHVEAKALHTDPTKEAVYAQKREAFDEEFRTFDADARNWTENAKTCLAHWRDNDRKEVERKAEASANKALKVDFSALRGRGPEFVLEFTAIIVIIFAATILGVGGVLDSNQIGTLLAAIAGYVLGKAASRSPTSPTIVVHESQSMPNKDAELEAKATNRTAIQGTEGAKQATVQNGRAYSP